MSFSEGINLDILPQLMPVGSWRGAKNALVTEAPYRLVTEAGTTPLGTVAGATLCGVVPLGEGRVCWFFLLEDGRNEIGILDGATYTPVLRARLDQSPDAPVQGKRQLVGTTAEYVVFWDGVNPTRVLNLRAPNLALDADLQPADEDLPLLHLQLPAHTPAVTLQAVTSGGVLPAGSYQLVLGYEDRNGTETGWLPPDRAVVVGRARTGADYRQLDGLEPGTVSGQQLQYQVTGIDTRYVYLRAAMVVRQNGVLTAYVFRRYPITGSTLVITHTGAESLTTLTPDEVLVPPVTYTSAVAGELVSDNDELLLGGLKTSEEFDYQAYANAIKVAFVEQTLPIKSVDSQRSATTVYLRHGYAHGEVLALYICFRLKSGQRSAAFHIPGRAASVIDAPWNTTGLTETTVLSSTPQPNRRIRVLHVTTYSIEELPRRRVIQSTTLTYYDTGNGVYRQLLLIPGTVDQFREGPEQTYTLAQLLVTTPGLPATDSRYLDGELVGIPSLPAGASYLSVDAALGSDVCYYQTRDTSHNRNASTNMGFWENRNEFYPNTAAFDIRTADGQTGTLRGQPVRHHKLPDWQTQVNRSAGAYPDHNGEGQILGLHISNVYIPPELAAVVEGYEICYAARSVADSLIVGQSISFLTSTDDVLLEGLPPAVAATDTVYATSGNWHYYDNEDGTADISRRVRGDWMRMHPPDALRTGTTLFPTHLRHEVLLGRTAKVRTPPLGLDNRSILVEVNFLDGQQTGELTGVYPVSNAQALRRVSNVQTVPGNTNPSGSIENKSAETAIVFKVEDTSPGDLQGLYQSTPVPWLVHTTADNGIFYPDYPEISAPAYGGMFVHHYLTSLCVYRQDVYLTFNQQDIIPTGFVVPVTAAGLAAEATVFGGDTYLTDYGFRTTSRVRNTATNGFDGIKALYYIAVEARMNIGLRYEGIRSYYPRIAAVGDYVDWLNGSATDEDAWLYSDDNHALNSTQAVFVPNEYAVVEFPNRIIRFKPNDREGTSRGWATLRANDYYDVDRNRGPLLAIHQIPGGRVVLHCAQGAFLTTSRGELTVAPGTAIRLGTGDLFGVAPVEVGSGNGEMGLLGRCCGTVTPVGYVFVSPLGEVVVLSGDAAPNIISRQGVRTWFRQHLYRAVLDHTVSNPYVAGPLLAWDSLNLRLLVGLSGENGWMWSWSPAVGQRGAWVGMHDYVPQAVVSSGARVLAWSRGFHEHNTGDPCVYYDGQRKPFVVEIISAAQQVSQWVSAAWVADVREADTPVWNETLTSLLVYAKQQSSGEVALKQRSSAFHTGNVRFLEGRWVCNDFRDQVRDPLQRIFEGSLYAMLPPVFSANLQTRFKPGNFNGLWAAVRVTYLPQQRTRHLALHALVVLSNPSIR